MTEPDPLILLGGIVLILFLVTTAIYRRERDERKKLRSQVTTGVVLGLWTLSKMFWYPWLTSSPDLRWPIRIMSVTAACAFFHLAWTKYFEYRGKYPDDPPLFKRQ